MDQTLAEKIISEHASKRVKAGESVVVKVDYVFAHDASGPLVMENLRKLGKPPAEPRKTIIFIDHAVPSPRPEVSNEQAKLRESSFEWGTQFSESGSGICHQIMAEDYASPGDLIIGSDSHTCTAGALGAFATGMGATDVAVAMALGKIWLRVPETFKVVVNGLLQKGVFSKDVILHVIGVLGADGGTYKSLEFQGSAVEAMEMNERLTLSNMAVEVGAKVGLVFTDHVTKEYLEKMGRGEKFRELVSDEDASYEETLEVDGSSLKPMVAAPHTVDNVKTIEEVEGEEIDLVFVGSCTNARIEDLRVVVDILKNKSLNTRLIVSPASRKTYEKAVSEGLITTFLESGAIVTPPGCGLCFGALGGVPADGDRVLSTSNRNFKGRMGNPKAFVYLASPATAAATAVEGRIADPRRYV
jgi:3-isopropylmalate/(R)-2-methylmalate dehydratase large subunit